TGAATWTVTGSTVVKATGSALALVMAAASIDLNALSISFTDVSSLSVAAGRGPSTVTVDRRADTDGATWALTRQSLTQTTAHQTTTVTWGTLDTLAIFAGSGQDQFTVDAIATTTVDAGGGNDTIDVPSASAALTVHGGPGVDTFTLGSKTRTLG